MLKNLKKKSGNYSELYVHSKTSVLNISRPPADLSFYHVLIHFFILLKNL